MSSLPKYHISFESRVDLLEIWTSVLEASGSLSTADKVLDVIKDSFETLGHNPGIGHSREDLTDEGLKFWSVYRYLIVYDPRSEPIDIIRVIHGARDLENLL